MNLSQLRAFDAVIRTGSFTAAAARLHVSQPAVTNHIKTLEDYYEVALFSRQGRGVKPTELGEQLAAISRRLFTLEEEANDLLQTNKALQRGTLRIAADGPYILMPLVSAFRQRFPGVRIAMTVASTREVQAALLSERCDVTVHGCRDDDPLLHVVPLSAFSITVVAAISHPWAMASRTMLSISELDGEALIVREKGSISRRVLEQACRDAGVKPDFVIETTSRETVKEAVAAGLGIGFISAAELRPDPRLWPMKIEDSELQYTEYVMCLKRRRKLRVVREFLRVTADTKRAGSITAFERG